MKTYKIPTKKFEALDYHIEAEFDEETIREFIKNNPELLTPTHKRKYFVPKVGEEYYVIETDGKKTPRTWEEDMYDKRYLKIGNCFPTEQDAQDELNRRQALVRIWNNYDDKYSWDIDWNYHSQVKYGIYYSHYNDDKKLVGDESKGSQVHTELPYFKSAEDRNQFVEENESDLKLIFNIKK